MSFVLVLIACVAGLVFCGGVVLSVARKVQNEIAG